MSTCSPPTGSTPRTRGTTRPWWPPGPPFLEKGYYSPLREALCTLALRDTADLPAPALLDSGCGEGYYTQGLFQALTQAGRTPEVAGVDISKFALRRAAKRVKEGEFAVASVYHLPVADSRADLLTNVFSPCARRSSPGWCAPAGTSTMWSPPPSTCGR